MLLLATLIRTLLVILNLNIIHNSEAFNNIQTIKTSKASKRLEAAYWVSKSTNKKLGISVQ